jgi:hypothetical protein
MKTEFTGGPPWLQGPLPRGIVEVPHSEWANLRNTFEKTVESISTADFFDENGHNTSCVVVRPSPAFVSWAVPEGILCFIDDYAALNVKFETAIDIVSGGKVVAWGIGFDECGCFEGKFDSDFRSWLRGEFIASPLAVMSRDAKIVMIFDEQVHFGYIGVDPTVATIVQDALGGEVAIFSIMKDYIEDFGVGFGTADRMWARKYLLSA